MTFAQRRNRLTTHFSEGIPVVKRRISFWPRLRNEQTLPMVLGLCTSAVTSWQVKNLAALTEGLTLYVRWQGEGTYLFILFLLPVRYHS